MIDFRSDTVTLPNQAMYQAIEKAPLGDDVYSDDPTVKALEDKICQLLAFEAALFVPSGTQANLIALLTHCQRGHAFITGQDYHIYGYEAGGGATFAGVQPQLVAVEADGHLDLTKVEKKISEDDFHFPPTKLLALENSHHGIAIPLAHMQKAVRFCQQHQLKLHLDGARIFNAAVKLGVDGKALVAGFDSVSVCLSKGLGAPVGSLLCGNAEFIASARRWRKMLGGGLRQAGILAACGLVALEEGVARLAIDHDNAAYLAAELSVIKQITVTYHSQQTNMVYLKLLKPAPNLLQFMAKNDINISCDGDTIRLVVHQNINRADIDCFVKVLKRFFA